MADLWMPGAEHQPQSNGGGMAGGPPRAVMHITWDSLSKAGAQPKFDDVSRYLKTAGYCPHLMWDPWSGRVVQYYPASSSARALSHPSGTAETNRMGSVCIQIEVFFSPGTVRDGRRYEAVADTPCKGLDKIVAWLRSWGIPDTWPAGWPKWDGNSRRVATWKGKAGYYGHCHVPANTHTDPGPMPRDMFGAPKPKPPTPRLLKVTDPLMTGADVKAVQTALNRHGSELTIDGRYGPRTAAEVKAFQKTHHLDADGVVGAATRKALGL